MIIKRLNKLITHFEKKYYDRVSMIGGGVLNNNNNIISRISDKRPSWDKIWMDLAVSISHRSCDPRTKVGSVVVTDDNTCVLAIGYNGAEKGGTNQVDSTEPGNTGFLHGEINSLIKLNYSDHRRKKMYITYSPCKLCSRAIVNADIKEVIYKEEYRDSSGLEILKKSNIKVRKINE